MGRLGFFYDAISRKIKSEKKMKMSKGVINTEAILGCTQI